MSGFMKKKTLPTAHEALPGRAEKMRVAEHFVNGRALAETKGCEQ